MPAGAWTFTNNALTRMVDGGFDFDTDSFKVALFLSTSNIGLASTTYAGVTGQHANANGYTTGGVDVDFTISGAAVKSLAFTVNPQWDADGGDIVARFAAVYEVGGDVVCFCLLDTTPADLTALDGFPLIIDSDGTPPLFTLEQI